jgi:O-antigen/teichoic acid export membrane protein
MEVGDVSAERPGAALGPDLGRRAFHNVAAQMGGRILIALSRLVVAGVIVRSFGTERFGEYSLVIGLLVLAEWVLDFGMTEIFVREMSRTPEQAPRFLSTVLAAKGIQLGGALAVLLLVLAGMGYPRHIVEAALVGALGMVFHGGVLVYRVLFKSTLTMGREAASEIVAVLFLIPLLWFACAQGAGLTVLIGCHAASRAVFFAMSYALGRSRYRPSLRGVSRRDVWWGFRHSAAIGTIGLLVGLYEALDLLLLAKLGTPLGLGYYSGAQRIVWPAVIAVAVVGATLYPIASAYWPRTPRDFERAFQRGVNSAVGLAGLAFCPLVAGAGFFIGLISPELVAGASALHVLGVLGFSKAIATTVGPILYVVHAQRSVLVVVILAVGLKAAVLALLIPRFGYVGAAWGSLVVEVSCTALPMVLLVQRITKCRLQWLQLGKIVLVFGLAVAAPRLLGMREGLAAALVAATVYASLVVLSRAVRVSELLALVRRDR